MAVFLRLCLMLGLALPLAVGCSSGDDTESEGGDGDGDKDKNGDAGDGDGDKNKTGDGDGDDDEPVGDDLKLFFNPMYSAYDGVHDFKLPAIVQGVQDVEWSARPADAVFLEKDTSTGGVLITTAKPGKVQIIARAGVLSGSAMLYITDASPEDWELGEERYNNEIPFTVEGIPDGGFAFDGGFPDGGFPDGGFRGFDGGPPGGGRIMIPDDLSCRNCHGSGAMALDVEHTPQQTGGYSDEDLISIFTMGIKPPGATFHTPFPEFIYTRFHTWEATPEEQKGIVVYLRSLQPKTQGPLDFQGLMDITGIGGSN